MREGRFASRGELCCEESDVLVDEARRDGEDAGRAVAAALSRVRRSMEFERPSMLSGGVGEGVLVFLFIF